MALFQPTYHGYVSTTSDAHILVEACLRGHLNEIQRRPKSPERNSLPQSGNIFIFNERTSGIRRWSDGVYWSPTRVLNGFFVARELDKPLSKNKKAKKRSTSRPAQSGNSWARPDSTDESYSSIIPQSESWTGTSTLNDAERHLRGSLIDSYDFKSDGLVKKTITFTIQDLRYHLISYYRIDDVSNGQLQLPSKALALSRIIPRPELSLQQGKYYPWQLWRQSDHPQNSGFYPHHTAYPQLSNQPDISAGYPVAPPAGDNFTSQLPVDRQSLGGHQHGGLRQSTYPIPIFGTPNMPLPSISNDTHTGIIPGSSGYCLEETGPSAPHQH